MSRHIIFALTVILVACGGMDMEPQSGTVGAKGDNLGVADQINDDTDVLVTEDMDGQTVQAKVGDTVKVWLAGNPTTGYGWELLANSRSLPLLEQGYVADEPIQTGSGGHFFFVFSPDVFADGKTFELRFDYARAWETAPINTFTFTLNVEKTCQPVLCELYCKYGFETDENGCGVCRCADPFACTEDSDCTMAKADCCGCQAGGSSIAVNKKYKSLVEVPVCSFGGHTVACPAVYMCFGAPACVAGQCTTIAPPQ